MERNNVSYDLREVGSGEWLLIGNQIAMNCSALRGDEAVDSRSLVRRYRAIGLRIVFGTPASKCTFLTKALGAS